MIYYSDFTYHIIAMNFWPENFTSSLFCSKKRELLYRLFWCIRIASSNESQILHCSRERLKIDFQWSR